MQGGQFFVPYVTHSEGEQFGAAMFGKTDRLYVAKNLDRLGVEYIEVRGFLARFCCVTKLGRW
jgi:isopropylmalate/homocitrate/citramalate synthase